VVKRHTNYPSAMLLFAQAFLLTFLLAAAASPATAQNPPPPNAVESSIPPQVHQLINLLDDPAIRTWMDQQRTAHNPPQTSAVEPQATLSTFTASRLALVRQHLQALAAALPNLPGEFRQTGSVLMRELRDWGLIAVILLAAGFALLGVGFEWLFWHATARVRARVRWTPNLRQVPNSTVS
jgi:moderate conductance mechanosensitive channel